MGVWGAEMGARTAEMGVWTAEMGVWTADVGWSRGAQAERAHDGGESPRRGQSPWRAEAHHWRVGPGTAGVAVVRLSSAEILRMCCLRPFLLSEFTQQKRARAADAH